MGSLPALVLLALALGAPWASASVDFHKYLKDDSGEFPVYDFSDAPEKDKPLLQRHVIHLLAGLLKAGIEPVSEWGTGRVSSWQPPAHRAGGMARFGVSEFIRYRGR